MAMLFNPNLFCKDCQGQLGDAYYELYRVTRQVMSGREVTEGELVAAAIALENIGEEFP